MRKYGITLKDNQGQIIKRITMPYIPKAGEYITPPDSNSWFKINNTVREAKSNRMVVFCSPYEEVFYE